MDDLGSRTLRAERGGGARLEMISFPLRAAGPEPLSVLAVGAHPDDIEIAAGGTLLTLAERHPGHAGQVRPADRRAEAAGRGPRGGPRLHPGCRP